MRNSRNSSDPDIARVAVRLPVHLHPFPTALPQSVAKACDCLCPESGLRPDMPGPVGLLFDAFRDESEHGLHLRAGPSLLIRQEGFVFRHHFHGLPNQDQARFALPYALLSGGHGFPLGVLSGEVDAMRDVGRLQVAIVCGLVLAWSSAHMRLAAKQKDSGVPGRVPALPALAADLGAASSHVRVSALDRARRALECLQQAPLAQETKAARHILFEPIL